MKKIFLFLSLLSIGLLWSACKKHDFAAGQPSPIIAVSDLRALYRGADVTLTRESMLGAHQIVGIVISNPDSGNAPSGMVVLQNNRRSQVNGIILPLGTAAANYHMGDSLMIEVEGLSLKRVNGAMQLVGVTEGAVTKVSANNAVKPRVVSSFTIKQNPDAYESTLVQVNKATVTPAPKFGDSYAGDKYLVNGADSVVLHTEANAHFASAPIPSLASFAGVLMVSQNQAGQRTLQVWPRMLSDVSDVTAPPDPSALPIQAGDIIITGIIADVKGGDGNYEYFQFMATRNIDFSKTPASVVTCTNAGSASPNTGDAPGSGWVTGGGRTYAFNLTEGKVNKGDYFYVGGSNKRINGANSTDISSAKWIRAIAYVTNDGDGFGSKSSGLLPNSGNAGGLAVFSGITIDDSTAPIDVVFFGGSGKTTIYNATTNKGYRIADNDHYSTKDAATGTDQPFLFQGTNLYIIPHPTPADAGIFMKLGGSFDAASKTWITPRGNTYYTLSISSDISEIETGDSVTKLTN
ncbi:hypothetical protein KHS38_06585 [Mucilaginibacter sp. Bleaf8]|uniref:DUF5689 domain-containing protein n=1 Tax=Mucilaginibacter sp. Bleaf8 TaxID=2834430 RepID=UPI001BCCC2FB|nr:DUF5689 domain-containing protein [Mucilaginibacter sp. Bleaf8]MBS7564068.1 hypothetical protein [Mucilaginibacter sp. Bleaf8]